MKPFLPFIINFMIIFLLIKLIVSKVYKTSINDESFVKKYDINFVKKIQLILNITLLILNLILLILNFRLNANLLMYIIVGIDIAGVVCFSIISKIVNYS